mgnify:FL=1
MIAVIGASGCLGTALMARFGDRAVGFGWRDLEKAVLLLQSGSYDVVFACGLTNPSHPAVDLYEANCALPRHFIEATADNDRLRYITVGTMMELFPGIVSSNTYVKSKYDLSEWIRKESQKTGMRERLLHLRLHTLYGGRPRDHLFLGQIASALKSGLVFNMSDGAQLREYHHVDDMAVSFQALSGVKWEFSGSTIEINSGAPVRLVDLAWAVFKAFGKERLLNVGVIKSPGFENREHIFPRSQRWLLGEPRDTVSGVIEWLKAEVGAAEPG